MSSSKDTVASLAKGVRVLESFTAREPELSLAEVARRAGLDNATAYRLLNTFVELGYVTRVGDARAGDQDRRRFRLTLKTLDLGFNAIAHMELREAVRPVLRSLVGEVNEAASVGVLEGDEVVYVERVLAGVVRLGVDIRIGTRTPAYCSSIGLAILAHLPEPERGRILRSTPRVKLTPLTVTAMPEIRRRLATVRRDGYALIDQGVSIGLRALAAPIFDIDGHPVGAVNVVAPTIRATLDQFVRQAAQPVRDAAVQVGRLLQASGGVGRSLGAAA